MNKSLASSILTVLLIFVTWFLTNYLSSEPYKLPRNEDLVIPFLWSCLFIYLHGKEHVYIAINSYVIFLLILFADKLNFGQISGDILNSYLLLSLAAVFIFALVYQDILAKRPRFASLFSLISSVVLYAIPLFYIIYAEDFGAGISREAIYAILQTNPAESIEFISEYISPVWIVVAAFFAIFIGFLLLKQEKKETLKIERSLLIFLVVLFSSLSYLKKDDIRLFSFAKNTIREYWMEVSLFKKMQSKLQANQIEFGAEKIETGETYIVVIGESLNKKHMGLYGYMRDTTPKLTRMSEIENLLVFRNAYSSHTHTMEVLSLSLTEANQHNKKRYYDSPSIVNVLNRADVDTYWVTNQLVYGTWDNLVSVIANQADHLVALNKSMGKRTTTQKHDDAVLSEVSSILASESKKSKVIFVHLMGSHGNYCTRYPGEYEKFSGELLLSDFGSLSTTKNISQRVNCYDNSVFYNDYVVSSLIDLLKTYKGSNGILYFSDHADDVFGRIGHNSRNFTYSMTNIPLIMWFSRQYKDRYQDKYKMLEQNKKKLFSNDDIYDTLIGVFNINTERYQAVNDLSSSQYFLSGEKAHTLHGKIPIDAKSNYLYHQSSNIQELMVHNQIVRVIPHRVNSIGKLKDVLYDGYRALELDVLFDYESDQFIVGHDQSALSGISFSQFLSSASISEIRKIWMDFKNLTEENYEKALIRLGYLDRIFSLKEKLIIESSAKGSFFNKFHEEGWHISYYLPTKEIIKLLDEEKVDAMEALAKSISEQSKVQNLSAVSFDSRLYSFVKKYLEPTLPDEIVYHTWDFSLKLYDADLQPKLNEKSYYNDSRIKTILLPYKSPFHL